MKKRIFLTIIIFLFITLYVSAIVPDVTPSQFTGTWLMKEEVNGEIVKRIWVIEANTSKSGILTAYKLNGEKEFQFTWEYYTENVYLFNYNGAYFMYYVYLLDEDVRRLRHYEDVSNQFEIYKISNSQTGFPDDF